MEQVYIYQQKPLHRGTQIVWFIITLIEIILLFRFILRFIGASTAAPFTTFVYNLAAPFVAPFQHMVPSTFAGAGVMDWNTLIAMAVYWVIGTLLSHLFAISRPVSNIETQRSV